MSLRERRHQVTREMPDGQHQQQHAYYPQHSAYGNMGYPGGVPVHPQQHPHIDSTMPMDVDFAPVDPSFVQVRYEAKVLT